MTAVSAPDMAWIDSRLSAIAAALDEAARADDPAAAVDAHRLSIAEAGGVTLVAETPPISAILLVVLRLATPRVDDATTARLRRPMLELAARALTEGLTALRAGIPPETDSPTVLALAALARAARPTDRGVSPPAQPMSALTVDGSTTAPRPAVVGRFRDEAVSAAERLRDALARLRAARDPLTSDEAAADTARAAEHLGALAGEYGLTAVSRCFEAARHGLLTLDERALWVLDEAGVELAEPDTPIDGLLPRFVALRARLDGMQPPPSIAPPRMVPPPIDVAATRTPLRGAPLADLLRDGLSAFDAAPGTILSGSSLDPTTVRASGSVGAAPPFPAASDLSYRGPSARTAARALRAALDRGDRAATPAAMDELDDLLRLAEE